MDREEFIERFAISFSVHSLRLWDKRSMAPPLHVSRSMYEVIALNRGKLTLPNSSAFAAIIHPVIAELHRKLPRGQRPAMGELAGLAYDALCRAGIQITVDARHLGHEPRVVNRNR